MKKLPDYFILNATLPTRNGLSFCQIDVKSITDWLNQIPITNNLKTSQLLFTAVSELMSLKVPINLRIKLIDTIAPVVFLNAGQLQKHYLNRPVILSNQEQLMVSFHKKLINALLQSYFSVIKECQLKVSALFKKPTAALTRASIGALLTLRECLINHYLLYQQPDKHFWLNLHKIYKTAAFTGITHKSLLIDDKRTSAVTVHNLYTELILLGSIKTEQLTQADILTLSPYIQQWHNLITVITFDVGRCNTISINTTVDAAISPPHREMQGSADLMLDIGQLLNCLKNQPSRLRPGLQEHLLTTLQGSRQRRFNRFKNDDDILQISIGLSATHYFIRNQSSFHELVFGEKGEAQKGVHNLGQASFTDITQNTSIIDIWDTSLFLQRQQTIDQSPDDNYNQYDETQHTPAPAKILNTSAGGYCLQVNCNNTRMIKSGDIIGIKSARIIDWSLATIRWVRQLDMANYQIGVELLCPSPSAFGTYIEQKGNIVEHNYLRAILIPKTSREDASLILPGIGLKQNQKLVMIKNTKRVVIILGEPLMCSGIFSQFAFQYCKSATKQSLETTKKPTPSLTLIDDSEHL